MHLSANRTLKSPCSTCMRSPSERVLPPLPATSTPRVHASARPQNTLSVPFSMTGSLMFLTRSVASGTSCPGHVLDLYLLRLPSSTVVNPSPPTTSSSAHCTTLFTPRSTGLSTPPFCLNRRCLTPSRAPSCHSRAASFSISSRPRPTLLLAAITFAGCICAP